MDLPSDPTQGCHHRTFSGPVTEAKNRRQPVKKPVPTVQCFAHKTIVTIRSDSENKQNRILQRFTQTSAARNRSIICLAEIWGRWQFQAIGLNLFRVIKKTVGLGLAAMILMKPRQAIASSTKPSCSGQGLGSRAASKLSSWTAKSHYAWFKGQNCGQCSHPAMKHVPYQCSTCTEAYFVCTIKGCSCREGRCVGH